MLLGWTWALEGGQGRACPQIKPTTSFERTPLCARGATAQFALPIFAPSLLLLRLRRQCRANEHEHSSLARATGARIAPEVARCPFSSLLAAQAAGLMTREEEESRSGSTNSWRARGEGRWSVGSRLLAATGVPVAEVDSQPGERALAVQWAETALLCTQRRNPLACEQFFFPARPAQPLACSPARRTTRWQCALRSGRPEIGNARSPPLAHTDRVKARGRGAPRKWIILLYHRPPLLLDRRLPVWPDRSGCNVLERGHLRRRLGNHCHWRRCL